MLGAVKALTNRHPNNNYKKQKDSKDHQFKLHTLQPCLFTNFHTLFLEVLSLSYVRRDMMIIGYCGKAPHGTNIFANKSTWSRRSEVLSWSSVNFSPLPKVWKIPRYEREGITQVKPFIKTARGPWQFREWIYKCGAVWSLLQSQKQVNNYTTQNSPLGQLIDKFVNDKYNSADGTLLSFKSTWQV